MKNTGMKNFSPSVFFKINKIAQATSAAVVVFAAPLQAQEERQIEEYWCWPAVQHLATM